MTAPNTCRIDRRIASPTERSSAWWEWVGVMRSATKVCLIRRQSFSIRLRLCHMGSNSYGCGRDNGCSGVRCQTRMWRLRQRCRDGIGRAGPCCGGCAGSKSRVVAGRSGLNECLNYPRGAEEQGVRTPSQAGVHCRIAWRTRRPTTPPIYLSLATNESRGIAQSGGTA